MSQSAIELVANMLRDSALEIEDAIESGDLPDKLLHQLACDCTERALQRLRTIGKSPEEQSWNALQAKQAWLIGEVDDEALKAAQEDVMTTDATTAWGVVRHNARNSARNCVRSVVGTATEAVTWDKRNDANESERAWLSARLIYLCEVWNSCGERSPHLLQDDNCPVECPEYADLYFEID